MSAESICSGLALPVAALAGIYDRRGDVHGATVLVLDRLAVFFRAPLREELQASPHAQLRARHRFLVQRDVGLPGALVLALDPVVRSILRDFQCLLGYRVVTVLARAREACGEVR